MEKKILIENLKTLILKTINGILAIFTAAGTIIIMSLHFVIDISFFPILFLFDFYLFYGQRLFLEKVCKIKLEERTKNEANILKYIALPLLLAESFVILYCYEYSFPIIKETAENFINNQS